MTCAPVSAGMTRTLVLLPVLLLAACGHETPLNGNDQQPVVNQTVPDAPPPGKTPVEQGRAGGAAGSAGGSQSGSDQSGSGQSGSGQAGSAQPATGSGATTGASAGGSGGGGT